MGGRWGIQAIEGALTLCMEMGAIERQPVSPLAHVLMGALDEAALYVAESDDKTTANAEMTVVLERIIDTLRPR